MAKRATPKKKKAVYLEWAYPRVELFTIAGLSASFKLVNGDDLMIVELSDYQLQVLARHLNRIRDARLNAGDLLSRALRGEG
jgi:hypothetical protein